MATVFGSGRRGAAPLRLGTLLHVSRSRGSEHRVGRRWSRREFATALGTAALWDAASGGLFAGQDSEIRQAPSWKPVRVRGRVAEGARGIGGVAVSDGLDVAVTGADGEFELISHSGRRFVFVSWPAGYELPRNVPGTARIHAPLEAGPNGEASLLFQLAPSRQSDENHYCFLLADPQTEDRYEVERFLNETVPDVRELSRRLSDGPPLGIGCGDLMFDDLTLFPEYEKAVHRMEMPFFQVVGNHDLDLGASTHEESTRTFQGHFGPDYYSFNRGAVHYVVLNDVFYFSGGYIGYLGKEQLDWLEADLRLVEPGRPVVVALHIPLASSSVTRSQEPGRRLTTMVQNRQRLHRLLEPYPAHVLAGHTHECEHVFEGNLVEHIHGAVCGAWWTGPICYDGTPNGYGVYEVRGEEIRWKYKATGRPLEEQMSVYARGADPSAPQEVVANVWNWDPGWAVVWYEDGERRGAMSRRRGSDPLSTELHAGAELPQRRPWVDPVQVDHLFYAPVSAQTREVRVEATDRFGQTYTGSVRLG